MSDIRRQYNRLDEWVRNLSRIQYAVLAGITSAVTVFIVGTLISDSVNIEAVTMGLTLTVFYYVYNPNQGD